MKKIVTVFIMLFLFFLTTDTAFALNTLRFNNNLISVGDLKNAVLVKCGEPASKEIIGYIDRVELENIDGVESEKRIRVMKIEEWILETNIYGTLYYFSLVFEGNKLTDIQPAGEKKIK